MNETIKQGKLLINYLLYFIAFISLCFIGIGRSYAYSYTVIGDQANITVVLVSPAYSSQPFNVPINSGYNFNQVLQVDYLVNNYNFVANRHYQLETHLTNQTFTNANQYSVTGANGEQCLIDYSASVFTGSYPRWDFQCPSATTGITLTIKNNANQYLWDNGVYTWTSALLSYSNESIPVSSDSQDIINNNNQNTQNIINNQNQNTQDIINNQNQNTQDIIESNKVCKTYNDLNIVYNGHLNSTTGETQSSNGNGVTDFIDITNSNISITKSTTANVYACFYYDDKSVQSCFNMNNLSGNITIPNEPDIKYFRFTIKKSSNTPNVKVCKNGNQIISDDLNNLTGALTDDSAIDINSLGNTAGWLPAGPIDSIINLPLNLFNNLLTALNGTCSPLNVPLPYVDRTLPIPCISTIFNQIDGLPNFWNWVGVITSVVILYRYLLALYKYYDDLTTMKANFISDFGGAP